MICFQASGQVPTAYATLELYTNPFPNPMPTQ